MDSRIELVREAPPRRRLRWRLPALLLLLLLGYALNSQFGDVDYMSGQYHGILSGQEQLFLNLDQQGRSVRGQVDLRIDRGYNKVESKKAVFTGVVDGNAFRAFVPFQDTTMEIKAEHVNQAGVNIISGFYRRFNAKGRIHDWLGFKMRTVSSYVPPQMVTGK